MNVSRRTFLINSVSIASATTILTFAPFALADNWNRQAFTDKVLNNAMKDAGYDNAVESTGILLKTQEIAENGAVVPIEATSNIPGTTSLAIFIDNNPNPLIAEFSFMNGAEPFIATRVKMAKTSLVRIAVKAGGKTYFTGKSVKVTSGGCGG